MKHVMAILAGFLGLLVVATPVSAHHRSGHEGGPPKESASQAQSNKQNKDDKQNKKDTEDQDEKKQGEDGENSGLHLGQLVRNLDDSPNALASEFRNCAEEDNLRDMNRGEIKRLARAAGLSTQNLKNRLDSDDLDDLEESLDNRFEANDIRGLSVGKLLQAAHACGMTTSELADELREDQE